MYKIMIILIVSILLLVAGCQFFYDMWPTEISPLAVKYAGKDPNTIKWYDKNLHTARELKNEVIDTYIAEQLRLDYLANLNKEKYQRVIGLIDMSIKQAEGDRMAAIGTLEKPGWLLAGLLTLLPVGTYLAGWRTLWPNHYTEQEVQAEIAKATTDNKTNPSI